MRVVLLENVEHLGIAGDIKTVTDGYARNFLLPENLAVKVGDKEGRIILKNIAEKRGKMQGEIKKLEKLAAELSGKVLEFELKTTEKGNLFGAVTVAEVAEKLKLDKKQIELAPIKTTGEHKVNVYLGHNIKTLIIIKIKPLLKKSNKKEAK